MTPRALVLYAIFGIQFNKRHEKIEPSYCLRSELLQELKSKDPNMKEDAIDEHLDMFVRLKFIRRGRTMNNEYYLMTELGIERLKDVV